MGRFSSILPLVGSALALSVLLVNGVLAYHNTRRLADNDRAVARSHAILAKLEEVLSTLKDAETGQRGFLITGERRYLAPYESALARISQEFTELEDLAGDDPAHRPRLPVLKEKVDRKLAELTHTVQLRCDKGFDAARDVVVTDKGQHLMEEIRRLAGEIEHSETDRLAVRKIEADRSFWTAQTTNLVGVVAGLGAVVVAFTLVYRDRTAELAQANGLLQGEVEERKRAEARVQAFADELQRSNRELQEFAAVASHDLQEPLRKIRAFGDRLKSKAGPALDPSGRDYLDRMQGAAARMATLISDLLAYSRVSTKAQPFVPVDLAAVVQEVLSDLEGRIQQTEGRVEVGPLPVIDADPLQMRQLMQNLIGNALKFHKQGEPPLVRVQGNLVRNAPDDPGSCTITVEDNGIGFEETYREKVFGFFQRLHGRNEYEGTGMGLAICRRIVERHGGTILASGKPGQGATFIVTLPAAQPAKRDDKEIPADGQATTTNHHPDGGR